MLKKVLVNKKTKTHIQLISACFDINLFNVKHFLVGTIRFYIDGWVCFKREPLCNCLKGFLNILVVGSPNLLKDQAT